ncbi:hypothetical protein BVX93_00070, partial [bacterium B13(2017)]
LLDINKISQLDYVNLHVDIQFAPNNKLVEFRRARFMHIDEYSPVKTDKTKKRKHFTIYTEIILPEYFKEPWAEDKEPILKEELVRLFETIMNIAFYPHEDMLFRFDKDKKERGNTFHELDRDTQKAYWEQFQDIYDELKKKYSLYKEPSNEKEEGNKEDPIDIMKWIKGDFAPNETITSNRNNVIEKFLHKKKGIKLTLEQFNYLSRFYEKLSIVEMTAILAEKEIDYDGYLNLLDKSSIKFYKDFIAAHLKKIKDIVGKGKTIQAQLDIDNIYLKIDEIIKLLTDANPSYMPLLIEDSAHGFDHFLHVIKVIKAMVMGTLEVDNLKTTIKNMRKDFENKKDLLKQMSSKQTRDSFIKFITTKISDDDNWFKKNARKLRLPKSYIPAEVKKIDWEALILASMFHDITTLHYMKDRKLHHIAGAKNAFIFIQRHRDYFKEKWNVDDEEFEKKIKHLRHKVMYIIMRHDELSKKNVKHLKRDVNDYKERV